MAEEITYSSLRNRQKREEEPGLTPMAPDFYRRVRERIAELHEEYDEAHAEDPSQQRTMVLLDEINKMQETLTELYHLRERKVVLAALAKARGGDPDVDGMTPVEHDLFESLVDVIRDRREEALEGPRDPPPPDDEAPAEPEEEPEPASGDAPAEEPDADEDDDAPGVERIRIRVLEDLEPFVASDMETYALDEDDVANLPLEQAQVLCRRGKAVALEPSD